MKNENDNPNPYTIDYIGTYLRNFAIFGVLAAMGAQMMRAVVKGDVTLSAIDLSRLVGLSDGSMI